MLGTEGRPALYNSKGTVQAVAYVSAAPGVTGAQHSGLHPGAPGRGI